VDGRDKPGHDGRRGWSWLKRGAIVSALLIAIAIGGLFAYAVSLGPLPLDEARQTSVTVVDRHGKLLRAFAMADGRWRLPVDAASDVDPRFLKLLFAYEDKRFAEGTNVVARAVVDATQKNGAKTIIGGGDSVKALNKAGLGDKVTFMSTGGGASLEFLEGKELPGVAALTDK